MSLFFAFLDFFFNDTATTEIYTSFPTRRSSDLPFTTGLVRGLRPCEAMAPRLPLPWRRPAARSEEHTSELQSQSKIVCRLLLEKKKKNKTSLSKHMT